MGSFKTYLKENEDILAEINAILLELEADEVDELGFVLYDNFFADDDESVEEFFALDDVNDMIEELGPDMYADVLDLLQIQDDGEEAPVSHQQSPNISEGFKNAIVVYDQESGEPVKVFKSSNEKKAKRFMMKDSSKYGMADIENYKMTDPEFKDKVEKMVVEAIEDEELEEGVSRRMSMKAFNKKKRKFMTKTKADLRRTKAQRKKEARTNRASRRRYYKANKQKIASYQKTRRTAIGKGRHKVKLRRSA